MKGVLIMEKKKVILVTGAAGFIGFHLSKYVIDRNVLVIGIDNINDYYDIKLKEDRIKLLEKKDDFMFCKGDISDKVFVEEVFEVYKPDIVINLAAQAGVRYSIEHPDSYIQSNLIGFFHLLEACRYHKVDHFVFASSSSVYGNQEKVPFSVSDNVDKPISLYAATKKVMS